MSIERALSRPVRRLVALGLLVAVSAALWGVVVRPLLEWTRGHVESLHDARFALERARALGAAEAHVTVEQVSAGERILLPWVLPGASESEAAANMQSIVDRSMKSEGLTVESTQNLSPVTLGAVRAIGIELRAYGTERSIARALAALERGRPVLRVDRAQLRAADAGGSLAGQPTPAPRVALEVRLVGFWIPAVAGASTPQAKEGHQ